MIGIPGELIIMRSAIPAAASFLEGDVDIAPEPAL